MEIQSNDKEIAHSCNFMSIPCIKTNILKQHIKNIHRENENTPCQFCKDTFITCCLKLSKIVKRENVMQNSSSKNGALNPSNTPLKTESNSENCTTDDYLFESEFLSHNNDDIKDEKKIDLVNVSAEIISSILKFVISNAILRSDKSQNAKLKCSICEFSYKKEFFKKHFQQAHEEKYHNQCTFCKRTFSKNFIYEHSKMCFLGSPQKCNICNKVFKSKSKLDNHRIVQHKVYQDQPGKCLKCNKTFKRPADLAMHRRKQHNEGTEDCIYKCDICEATFTRKDTLKRHAMLGRHQKPKNYPCKQCSVSFESEKALKTHNSLTHSSGFAKLAKCETCNKELINEDTLRFHKRNSHPELAIREICYLCQKEFKTKGAVEKHIMKDHNGYKCLQCGKTFRSDLIHQIHVKKVHEGLVGQKCDYCDYTAINIYHFRVHVRKNHTEKKQFQCSDCNRIFNQKYNLTSHVKSVHQKIKDKKCPHCEATFSRADNLNSHVTSAHGTKENLVCDQCGKHFVRHDALREHILGVHNGEVNLLCDICGKSFLRKRRLRLHLNKVHKVRFSEYDVTIMGEKSKLCNYCGKNFSHAKNLSKHLIGVHKVEETDQNINKENIKNEASPNLHTRIKISSKKSDKRHWIYKCELCLEVFEGRKKYNNHILTVHPEKHKCTLCGKSFADAFYLSTHLKAHQRQDCQTCKMSFLTTGYLKSHMAEFHNGVDEETSKS